MAVTLIKGLGAEALDAGALGAEGREETRVEAGGSDALKRAIAHRARKPATLQMLMPLVFIFVGGGSCLTGGWPCQAWG
jgi:hypothetical protein